MLDFLGGNASPGKLRLFACAVGRHLPRLRDRAEQEEREAAIAVAERFADGLATQEELRRALPCSAYAGAFWNVCLDSAWQAADMCARESQVRSGLKAWLLRDLLGNPFRPVVLEPAWPTADVVTLARAAYHERIMPRGDLNPAHLAICLAKKSSHRIRASPRAGGGFDDFFKARSQALLEKIEKAMGKPVASETADIEEAGPVEYEVEAAEVA
jgi:hypothetical protein